MSEPTLDLSTPTSTGGDDSEFINSIDAAFEAFNEGLTGSDPEPETRQAEPEVQQDEPEVLQDETEPEPSDPNDPLNELDDVNTNRDWTPEAARRFKELKSELKTTKQLLQEREQVLLERENRLQELDAVANNPALEEMQTKLQDYEKRLLVSDLESSPIYQEIVHQPLSELVGEAFSIADKYGMDGDSLVDVLALTDEAAQEEALSDLLEGASDRDKFRVYKIIDDMRPILHRREVLRQNAQEALQELGELNRTQDTQMRAERAQQRAVTANEVASRLRSKLTFLESIEGVDLAALTREAAATDPAVMDDVTSSYQVLTSKIFPKLAREYVMLQREIEALTNRLAEYDNAKPRAGSGSTVSQSSSPTGNKSFLDAVSEAFGSA